MLSEFISIEELHQLFLSCAMQVCTDTRKAEKGSMFFALKGENFDANLYAEKAILAGCSYAIVDNPKIISNPKFILVENVLNSLQELANYHRKKFNIPVLAITGSNGKTTTKELIGSVLSQKYNCLITQGNFNNHIGVPLTLLSLNSTHEIAVIEMGANHQGEINSLCEIAEPNYGLITNIGKAHLEGFGGFEGVKKGKGELFYYLKKNKGTIFLNGDDIILTDLASENEKITYGATKLYDVVGKQCGDTSFAEFKWKTRYNAASMPSAIAIKTNLIGKYNFMNALCAACIGNYFKVEEGKINSALVSYKPINNRSQLFKSVKNTLVLDMYNANPSSMRVAIESFSLIDAQNKMVILGDMFELGIESDAEHALVLSLLNEKNINECLLIGPNFFSLSEKSSFIHFNKVEDVINYIEQKPILNKTILVKGSRGMQLEKLISLL